MAAPACSEEEFIRLFQMGGAIAIREKYDVTERNIYRRRRHLEEKLGRPLLQPSVKAFNHPERYRITVKNGTVFVGSDCHYWPGEVSTAHRAFVALAEKMQPKAVVMNGDVLDFSQISRHDPIGHEQHPILQDELEAAQKRLQEIREAAPKAERVWPLGNHDARFEARLAAVTPEYARVKGFTLEDHFPKWRGCWSCWINDDVVIKHRWKGGIHATHNNTVQSGKTMITGHLHSQKVTPYSDLNGTRYGVDCGTMADPDGKQFHYTEDSPKNWRSGFVVLTFWKGMLLPPELVTVLDQGRVTFRGEVIDV